MKKQMLLPHGFKKVGWVILIPTLVLGILMAIDGFNGVPTFIYAGDLSETLRRATHNIALIGILLGIVFIACSRERIEDELIGRIRLSALLVALYANTAVVVVSALAVYELTFLYIMVYNLFTLPLLFLVVFRWKLWRLKKQGEHEK